MTMNRWAPTWVIFGLCLAAEGVALGWISLAAIKLERDQVQAQRQAEIEEDIRLALWRMDSALAPLVGQENAWGHTAYEAFSPAPRAYTKMYAQIETGAVLVPSPLLTYQSPYIYLHWQIDPQGNFSSPQAPTGNRRDLAEVGYTTHEQINAAADRLDQLRQLLDRATLLASVERRTEMSVAVKAQPHPDPQRAAARVRGPSPMEKNTIELRQRISQYQANTIVQRQPRATNMALAQSAPQVGLI